MKIENKTRIVWPLLALSGTALAFSTAGVVAQTPTPTLNQTNPGNLPQPPQMAQDAGPGPDGGPPAPPEAGRRGPGLDGVGPADRGPDGRRLDSGGPGRGCGPEDGRPGPGGPRRGPGPDGVGPADGRPGPDGPGPDGPGRGPRHDGPRPTPLDANTADGSARSLEGAYRVAGEVGTVDGEAREVSTQARALYAQAMTAYNAKNYAKAFQLADGSERLSRTAQALDDADGKPLHTVAGLTPPPVVKKQADDVSERSVRELNRAFHETNRATGFDNPFSKQLRGRATANYRTALTAYNAKHYDEAARRARLGAEEGKAAREYGETLKS